LVALALKHLEIWLSENRGFASVEWYSGRSKKVVQSWRSIAPRCWGPWCYRSGLNNFRITQAHKLNLSRNSFFFKKLENFYENDCFSKSAHFLKNGEKMRNFQLWQGISRKCEKISSCRFTCLPYMMPQTYRQRIIKKYFLCFKIVKSEEKFRWIFFLFWRQKKYTTRPIYSVQNTLRLSIGCS